MPLNSSGPISLAGSTVGQSIALELGRSATGQISINDSDVRALAGILSGQIALSNFYGKSSSYLDETDIILPLTTNTYTITVFRYNFTNNTATTLGTLSQFYTQGSSQVLPSVARSPAGDVYFHGKGSTSNSSYNNWGYLAKNSNTPVAHRFYSGLYNTYGDYGGGICWNSTYNGALGNVYPLGAENSNLYQARWVTYDGTGVTNQGYSAVFGFGDSDVDQGRSVSASGTPSLSGYYIGLGGNDGSYSATGNAYSGYTLPNGFMASLAPNPSRGMLALTSSSGGAAVQFGRVWNINGTELTTALSGVYSQISDGQWRSCGSFGTAWVAASDSWVGYSQPSGTGNYCTAFGSVSTAPSWAVDLSSFYDNRCIDYFIGNGQTLYIVSHSQPNRTVSVDKYVFNLSSGGYSFTRNNTTMTVNSSTMLTSTYRYY